MTKPRRNEVLKAILLTIGAVGFLSIALVAPNAVQLLKGFTSKGNDRRKYNIDKKIHSLINNGLLKREIKDGKVFISLTQIGQRELDIYRLKDKNSKKQKWDKKWRVFTFDVWEKSRWKRDLLRMELKEYGFIQLQRSVWIYPYDCSEFINLIKADLNFGKNVRYMVVEELDNDQKLRHYFNLS